MNEVVVQKNTQIKECRTSSSYPPNNYNHKISELNLYHWKMAEKCLLKNECSVLSSTVFVLLFPGG